MNNCKNLKIKLNRSLECEKLKRQINIKECTNCQFKEYKTQAYSSLKNKTQKPIKMRSKKLSKLEKNRFSLFSKNTAKCYFCHSTHQLTWHEIFRGRNRSNSMKYGLCLRMCLSCHERFQDNKEFNEYWHKKGQALFEKAYPDLDFVDIFKRNYK